MMQGMGSVHAGNAISREKKRSVMFKLAALMKPYGWIVALACLLGVVLNLAPLLNPVVMEMVIDDYLTPLASDAVVAHSGNWFLGTLEGLGTTYFLVILVGALASYAQSMLMTKVCQRILHDLRMRAFDHIHRMKLRNLDIMGSGRLLTRATNDIEALDEFYGDILLGLFKDVFLLIGIVLSMLLFNWRLALVAFSVVPVIMGITFACRGALRRNFVKMKALIGRINGFIAESLSGIRIIQAFNREKEKYEELRDLNLAYRKTTVFQVFMNSFLRPLMEVVNAVGVALVLVAGF
jgi:ATP-binding cassette subfamily B protein